MTTIDTARSLSLREVITEGFGGADHLDDHLTSKVLESRGVSAVLPSTRRSIDGQLRAAVNATLSRDVIALLGAGWQASSELREAARRTASTPDITEFVELLRLTITQSIRPSARVYLDRELMMTVELEIVLEAGFHELTAVVRSGALMAIDFGQCDATVSIRTGAGTPLINRTLSLTSNARLGLPHPIALVTPPPR